jgi:DNA polymerase-3 subunit delta
MVRVFCGANSYMLKQELNKVKTDFIKKYGELSVEVIDGEEASYEQIKDAVNSVPFLAEKKLVIIHGLGQNKAAAEKIEELAEAANELTIVEPKPDKRSAYYKFLKKNAEVIEFSEPDEHALARWLVEEAGQKGAKLGLGDANYLIQRVGLNQQHLNNELNKLIDFGQGISRETIDRLTEASPQTTIFNLLDSAFSGNMAKAMDIYEEQRTQGEEPLKIFGLLVWQMHLVALVDSAKGRSDSEIMNVSGLKPFTLNKSRSIARRMGRERIRKILSEMVETDRMLKFTSVDADEALKSLLVSIS